MRKFLIQTVGAIFLMFFLSSLRVTAQYIHYQGAARTKVGLPLANENIAIRISILGSSPEGEVEFWEVRKTRTNPLGLYSFNIGSSDAFLNSAANGKSFDKIDWSNQKKYLRVELDPTGGNNFSNVVKVVELNSVPFANYAREGGTSGYNFWKQKPENANKTVDEYFEMISDGGNIADNSIENKKLKDATITGDKIAQNTLNDSHIVSVSASKISPGIQGQVLQTTENGVEWVHIEASNELDGDVLGSTDNNRIKDEAITNSKIATSSVSSDKLTAGAGVEGRVGIANAEGTVVYQDFQAAIHNVQKQSLLQNGENTQVVADTKDNITTYQVNVAKAIGASNGAVSQLGLVKEKNENPSIRVDEEGALYLDEEITNHVVIKDVDYQASKMDKVIIGNASKNSITITLPAATQNKGKQITVKKQDTNEDHYVFVMGDIAGLNQAQNQLYTALPYTGWVLVSDGTQWQIINKF